MTEELPSPTEYVRLICSNCSSIIPLTSCGPGIQNANCTVCGYMWRIEIYSFPFAGEEILWN